MAQLSVSLLGTFQVMLDGELITDFATDKARALLVYLVVEADRPHRRETLAGLLWPDQPEDKARQNVRQALSHLRRAICDSDKSPFLLVCRDTLQFNLDGNYWLDVAEFSSLVKGCEEHRHRHWETCLPCIRRQQQLAELYRGEFLEQFFLGDSSVFEEWALLKRESFHRAVVMALGGLADYYERRGEFARARHYARRQVQLEPWREEAYRQLMRLLAFEGQRSAALAQYEACRQILVEELGVEPTGETRAVYERIRAGDDFSLIRLHSLPLSPAPFVGRTNELVELADYIADPDCRLVTLVGPGGIGKTRLALQAAADQVGAFAHGVYFVSLVAINSAELLVSTMADVLGCPLQGQQDPKKQLLNYLRQKEMLVLLDNFEHLLISAEEVVEVLIDLLQCAPRLVLLVTSRERLNLQEEWVYDVGGLTYPTDNFQSSQAYSAVDLFLQRARQVYRHFIVTKEEEPYIVRICQLVDGMPLGVELAAAWVRERSCRSIAQEIEFNLGALATSLRNLPERHRSIWATFEYSWSLLSEQERMAFARLSVFQGGFDRCAVEAVTDIPPDILATLIQKSLLCCDAPERCFLHPMLQQYAAEKLDKTLQREEIRGRHAAYYAAFLQQREKALQGSLQPQALAEIRLEIDNVRCAWQWALAQLEDELDQALAVAILQQSIKSLYLFYIIQGWFEEGRQAFGLAVRMLQELGQVAGVSREERDLFLGKLLACQGKCCEIMQHADAAQLFKASLALLSHAGAKHETALPLQGLGYMAYMQGKYEQARQHFEHSLSIFAQIDDRWGCAASLNRLSEVLYRQGAFGEAKERCEQGLLVRRQMGDRQGIASSLRTLGLIHCALGEYAEAKVGLQEALQLYRQLDNKVGVANALTGLCQATFSLGEIELAEKLGRESLAVYKDVGDQWGVAIAFNNLGHMAVESGDYAKAKPLYQQSVNVYRQAGIKAGWANALGSLGAVCYELGEYAQARQYLYEALQLAREIGAIPTVLKTIVNLAPVLVQQGDLMLGLEALAFAMQQSSLAQAVREKAVGMFSELSAGLSTKVVADIQARGQVCDLEDVVAELLGKAQV